MIKFANNPFDRLLDIVSSEYPGLKCTITFVEELHAEDGTEIFGAFYSPNDDPDILIPEIYVSVNAGALENMVDITGHELAHLITEYENDHKDGFHGATWKKNFDWINDEFMKRAQLDTQLKQ